MLSLVKRGTSRQAVALRILDDAFVPDERKTEVRKRLARAKGQVEGIERMLDQNRPCVEILTQISAAHEALRGAGRVMVRNYLERCASSAIKAGREQEVYDELMDVIFKLTR
jgi:DNA-binding FrmR family transcriptional regulator